MSNPFPGMNPYMEAVSSWSSVHNTLSVYLADALSERLPVRYAVQVDENCRVIQTQRIIAPDVVINHAATSFNFVQDADLEGQPDSDLLLPDKPVLVRLLPAEPPETYINIVDVEQGNQVVAAIEILSPVNKARGEGRNAYLAKQDEFLNSRTHLIEIDLLRAGTPTVAAGHPVLQDAKPYHYIVCLHRSGQGHEFEVWPSSLHQRLPNIAVPLAVGDADVALDLQAAVDRCYERRGFAQKIDYTQPPNPPLMKEDAEWADALLREKGLRL